MQNDDIAAEFNNRQRMQIHRRRLIRPENDESEVPPARAERRIDYSEVYAPIRGDEFAI